MPWMSDEQYELMQDTKEKKITARSARHTRSHCGKGGAVKFPSDYLTAKERKKLSGECKTYRMNEPLTWAEFKELPDDLKKSYVKALRAKYNVPNIALAEMFGVSAPVVTNYFKCLGLAEGKGAGGSKRTWNKDGFLAWRSGASDTAVAESETDIPVEEVAECLNANEYTDIDNNALTEEMAEYVTAKNDVECSCDNRGLVPNSGTLVFEGNANDILRTMQDTLRNRRVKLSVQWTVVGAPDVVPVTLDTDALKRAATSINYSILNAERKKRLGTMG